MCDGLDIADVVAIKQATVFSTIPTSLQLPITSDKEEEVLGKGKGAAQMDFLEEAK